MSFPIEHNEGRIYTMDDGTYTVSFRGQWVCGVYADVECAKSALFHVSQGRENGLQRLWDHLIVTPKVITGDMLRSMERTEIGL